MKTCQHSELDSDSKPTSCGRPATVYVSAIGAHLCLRHAWSFQREKVRR